MTTRLCALGAKLVSQMAGELLDRPIDALDEALFGGDARELLLASYEAGVASSLRELLSGDRLQHWVERTCTERENELLCAAFERLLGKDSELGPDDPARLGEIDALPDEARALRAWAARYDLLHELIRPAREVLGGLTPDDDITLAECALGAAHAARPEASLLGGTAATEQARRHLSYEARRVAALPAREAAWRRPKPSGALRNLLERLLALLDGVAPAALHALCFVPARPVKLDPDNGVCSAQLRAGPGAEPIHVQLYLSGFEQRAIHATCSVCKRLPCLHVQALAGRLIDACFLQEDSLHRALSGFVAQPSWQRFFALLETARPAAGERARERLSFVLRLQAESALVGVLSQTLGADGSYSNGRLLAPARALNRSGLSDQDRAVLDALAPRSRTLGPSFLPADLAVLRALSEHPQLRLEGDKQRLTLSEQTLEVRVLEHADGLVPSVLLDGAQVRSGARAKGVHYLVAPGSAAGVLCFAALTPALKRLLAALEHFRGVLPKESFPSLASYLASLDKVAHVVSPKLLLGLERPTPRRFVLRLVPSLDEGLELTLAMSPFALSGLWPPGTGPALVHGLIDGEQLHARRDLDWERSAAAQLLEELDLSEAIRIEPFRYRVETTQAALALLTRAARLSERLAIEWAERGTKLQVSATVATGDLKVALFKRGAFLFPEGEAQVGPTRLALSRLLDAARHNERFVRIEGGDYAQIERELFERLQNAQLCVMESAASKPRLSSAAARFWLRSLGDVTAGGDIESRRWLEAAEHAAPSLPAIEPLLEAQLRSYQREGVQFLLARASWAPGACLADEMGLGKTVQSIALLGARAPDGPALVVCPTSLVDNWRAELARFAPALRALSYRGVARQTLLQALGARDVLVVSYELLLRDRAHFDGLSFATQIIDEAQVVKNARTLRARAVASIDARFRVALSGTPVENRLGDLWSLFQLIVPGLLGSWSRFRARFAVPIERYANRERAAALKELVEPFVLRRRKDEVATELPARTEVVQLVALSPAERELYLNAVAEARRAVGKRKPDDTTRRLHILAELTRLRQLACHPRLVIEDARVESSKLNALLALLDDVLPRGHRVLIFSQFVTHLALIREALSARGISMLWLDGSTPSAERAERVKSFQAGAAQTFLISLKAGGTGLNLTAADYVVHMDPWWNPSAQDQASDRAHRIGQGRPVTIVKLVAQDTIEERVLALHEHKRHLAASVIESNGAPGQAAASHDYEALLAAPS